ncbi:MAG TPA: hypothetical protein VFI92_01180 [Steroidobacteraceae bacterium]|nr:hypothetical protein [Steroidobacteraceae bacterium]
MQIERADATARIASLAGLALALTGATRVTDPVPRVVDFRFEAGARPRLEQGPPFSVSHTTDRVACVVCAVGDVGLDIETLPSGAGPTTLRELSRWTATEATLKAAGLGLRQVRDVLLEAPPLAAILHGRRYALREFQLASRTIGHVASVEPLEVLVDSVALDGVEVSSAVQRALGLPTQG